MEKIKLIWEESNGYKRNRLENKKEIKDILISELGELGKQIIIDNDGIKTDYSLSKLRRSGYITKFSGDYFDLPKNIGKYLELSKRYDEILKIEQNKRDFEKSKKSFIHKLKIEGLDITDNRRRDDKNISFKGNNIDFSFESDGLFKKCVVEYSFSSRYGYTKIDDVINKLNEIKEFENRVNKELEGKNIFG